MGLFDKKYCDICGEKIGLLGNRKLEDGNLCKNCAKKLSPFFNERRHSTVEDIKAQLTYREENAVRLADFHPNVTFDGDRKVYIDTVSHRFIVTPYSDWRNENPDLIELSQVRSVNTDIHENKTELYYKDEEGNRKSYFPRRYECDYEFNVTILVDSPWFDEIELELSDGNRPDSPYTNLYREYERRMHELSDCLMGKNSVGRSTADEEYNSVMAGVGALLKDVPSDEELRSQIPEDELQRIDRENAAYGEQLRMNASWMCPSCGTPNVGGKFCQNCGAARPEDE